ncbi:MAG: DUF262 domain-containing protein [bacterium]
MHAKETKLQDILEGTKQYVIPLFQRTYSWEKKEWETLWKDLIELCEAINPRPHFIGSIVSMPTISVPEGVAKYLLIDGQQRLTTIFILLAILRDKAIHDQNKEFADEINNTLLVNPYKKDNDYFKLMPTQDDRDIYYNLINGIVNSSESQLINAYAFFEKKIRQIQFEHKKLKEVITSYFSVVSIVLDPDDNPYLVFESLNAKGKPLTQADLIRNYFFMRIHIDKQNKAHDDYWQPMQDRLKDDLTEYIRHFLMINGNIIKQNDVYYVIKETVSTINAIDRMKELEKYSVYYHRLIYPEFEPEIELKKYFHRLNRIEVTTAYPLLLNLYNDYQEAKISITEFIYILKILENYLIRRFVCNVPTNQLNKIFPVIYSKIKENYPGNIIEGIKSLLQEKNYPKDEEFYLRFNQTKFYGAGDRNSKTKLILESIEESFGHKEAPNFKDLTIEHIMPQTLSEQWQNDLGVGWEETYELFLDTMGNLTLSAYNSELSNAVFSTKKQIYNDSHLELNRYFSNISSWTKSQIEERTEVLAKKALEIWNYFGEEKFASSSPKQVTGTTPTELNILGQQLEVKTWRDVLEQTLNTIADLDPDKFDIIARNFSRFIGKDESKFRATRKLQNGYFFEVNLSAQKIQKLCFQAMEIIELASDDWNVKFV